MHQYLKYSKILITFSSVIIILTGLLNVKAQESHEAEDIISKVAYFVLENTHFKLLDTLEGHAYKSAKDAPSQVSLTLTSPYNDWRYWNGVINLAMLELAKVTDNPIYFDFVTKNITFGFDNYEYFQRKYNGENKWNYPFGQFFLMEELDDYGAMGASVIEVYKIYPQQRFKLYIEKAADHILSKQHRLEDDTLVRSFPGKWTLWADDLYMSISFLARYGELIGDTIYFNDAANQVINFNKYLFDENKGLMHHNWYSDIRKPGVAYWGRANGWAMLAQIDLLERLPENYPKRDNLIALFQRHVSGIAQYQGATGLWHQLLDKNDSYLETSCSAMFTYAIARAVRKGFLNERYSAIAKTGWEGVASKILPDGQVAGVCAGTIVYDDLKSYYLRPTPLNDIHGIGAVILAGTEILRLKNQ